MTSEAPPAHSILISSGDYYPNAGGVVSLFDVLIPALQQKGLDAFIVTRQWPGLSERERRNGYDIIRFDYPMLFERLNYLRNILIRSPRILVALIRLLRERRVRTVCIGLVDTSAIYFLLLRPLFRFRLTVYLHGSDETSVLPCRFRSYAWVLRWCLRAADCVIPVSEQLAEEAAGHVPSARRKMRVIANGIDLAAIRACPPMVRDRPYITFVGRLVPEKGVDVLIQAFHSIQARVPDVDLIIAGNGAAEASLRELAAAGAGASRIQFTGKLPKEQCHAWIKGSRFTVLPSWREGSPIVAIEALAAGTPLIASRIPGIAGVVQEGRTGEMFPPGDVAALAGLLERFCTDPAALAKLTAGVRLAGAETRDIHVLAAQHLEAYGLG